MQTSIDYKQLRKRCLDSIEDYHGMGEVVTTYAQTYTYIDRGAKVLAVAHLDTVCQEDHFHRMKIAGEELVYCARLDNRLGAYIILDLLPTLGVKCDVLLTEDEELSLSSARWFTTNKKYNWAFSFDRAGSDVVLYHYDDSKTAARVRSTGARIGIGSYSDICDLTLGVKAVNWGNGIVAGHSARAYVEVKDTLAMVQRFVTFYDRHKKIRMPHNHDEDYPSIVVTEGKYTSGRGAYDKAQWEYDDFCDYCGVSILAGDDCLEYGKDNLLCVDCIDILTRP